MKHQSKRVCQLFPFLVLDQRKQMAGQASHVSCFKRLILFNFIGFCSWFQRIVSNV